MALATLLAASLCADSLRAWGWTAHRIITSAAAERVTGEPGRFFQDAAVALEEVSLEPDSLLRRRDPEEPRRHFVNLDALEEPPFGRIPRRWEDARERYGVRRLRSAGTLPWHILDRIAALEEAMSTGSRERIIRQAGHLAHYLGDLFQPLHLTSNHDGAESCNLGIHDAFESEMIERRAAAYRRAVAGGGSVVREIEDPAGRIFAWMRAGYLLVDEILTADSAAVIALKRERKDYYETLDMMAGPVAERQMSAAADAIASLWYTAWVNSGRPRLPGPAPPRKE